MSKIYIFGAHVKLGYDIEVKSFNDISSKVKSHNHDISHLINGHKWKYNNVLPKDECNARTCSLLQWSECISGTISNRGIYCRVALMNDEVLWQWRTGSTLTYRFESLKDSYAYYKMLFTDADINLAERSHKYEVGDIVRLNAEITSTFGYTYKIGDEFRVFDVQNCMLIPSGIDGKTYIRIPGTGGAKLHIGYCLIDQNNVSAVKFL